MKCGRIGWKYANLGVWEAVEHPLSRPGTLEDRWSFGVQLSVRAVLQPSSMSFSKVFLNHSQIFQTNYSKWVWVFHCECFAVRQGLQHLQLKPDWRWGTRLQHDIVKFSCGIQHENHMNHRRRDVRRHCQKVGDRRMAALQAAQCCDVWFNSQAVVAAALRRHGDSVALLGIKPCFVYFSYYGMLRLQYRLAKLSTNMQHELHVSSKLWPFYRFWDSPIFSDDCLRLPHFNMLWSTLNNSEVGATTRWDGQRGCRRRAGDLGVELGRSWLDIFAMRRSWLSFSKFRPSFTELTLTSPHHLLPLEVVPNPDKNGEFFEAHLHGGETATHLTNWQDFESTPAEAKSGKTGMLALRFGYSKPL